MKLILVVDDSMTVRMYHGKVLADAGWRVLEAANGVEALEKVVMQPAGAPFDLYVVDVNMPKMDGYTFVRELRSRAELPQAPVLMVSTEAQARDASAALDAGANAYFIKPVPRHELLLTAALLLGDAAAATAATAASAACPASAAAQGVCS
jgi:two-component system chemotaxis response regulator CheY